MTADRRNDRHSNRNLNSSPYFRRTQAATSPSSRKSTSWSLSGLLKFLNPLRSNDSIDPAPELEPEDRMDETNTSDEQDNEAGPSTSTPNGHVSSQNLQVPPSTPTRNPAPSTPQSRVAYPSIPNSNLGSNVSPMKNVDAVKNYLTENASRQLNQVEIAGLVSLLQDSIDEADESVEPFRFSRSPSAPARSNSPISPIFPTANSAFSADNNQTPNRPLSKNPNGNYRWQGAGSARPRNRFHSPAFGSSRSTPSKMKITPTEPPKTDTKRRRVGHDAETSSPQRVPTMQPSANASASVHAQPVAGPSSLSNGPPKINGITASSSTGIKSPAINGAIASSRVLKATAPAVPSPLRQAWGQNDTPSPSPHPPASRQTRAASFMTELIREATPIRKPDVSNPYQTASPVKPSKPLKKVPPKRARPSPKPPTEEKVELSPQTIIEATIPKGSQRSKPPPGLTATETELNSVAFPSVSPSPPPRQPASFVNGFSEPSSKEKRRVTVEDVEDVEYCPAAKRPKMAAPTIIEVKDVDIPSVSSKDQCFRPPENVGSADEVPSSQVNGIGMPSLTPTTPMPAVGSPRSFFGLKSSIPKEPSKLRFSIQPDKDEKEISTTNAPDDARSRVSLLSLNELTLRSDFNYERWVVESNSERAASDVRNLAVSALHSYDFSFPTRESTATGTNAFRGSQSSVGLSAAVLPSAGGGFNWAAAGMKAPGVPSRGAWICSTCLCQNMSGDADKCSVCDTPR